MSKMFYTLDETQVALGLHDDEIQVLIAAGKLREFRDGKRLMFKTDQVDELAAELKADPEFDGGHNITDEDLEDEDIEMGVMDDDALKNFIANHAMTKIKGETPAKPVEAVEAVAATRPFGERKPIVTVQSSRTSVPENTEVAVAPRKTFTLKPLGGTPINEETLTREKVKEIRSCVDTLNRLIRSASSDFGLTVQVTPHTLAPGNYDKYAVNVYKEVH